MEKTLAVWKVLICTLMPYRHGKKALVHQHSRTRKNLGKCIATFDGKGESMLKRKTGTQPNRRQWNERGDAVWRHSAQISNMKSQNFLSGKLFSPIRLSRLVCEAREISRGVEKLFGFLFGFNSSCWLCNIRPIYRWAANALSFFHIAQAQVVSVCCLSIILCFETFFFCILPLLSARTHSSMRAFSSLASSFEERIARKCVRKKLWSSSL
jgi:hypothetical protein